MNNEIKTDSKEFREFDTGFKRDIAEGKGRFDLLPMRAIWELAKHCEKGAKKYGERNIDKGAPVHSLVDSAFRHLIRYSIGETDEPHLVAAMWNIAWIIEQEQKGMTELVDIPAIKSTLNSFYGKDMLKHSNSVMKELLDFIFAGSKYSYVSQTIADTTIYHILFNGVSIHKIDIKESYTNIHIMNVLLKMISYLGASYFERHIGENILRISAVLNCSVKMAWDALDFYRNDMDAPLSKFKCAMLMLKDMADVDSSISFSENGDIEVRIRYHFINYMMEIDANAGDTIYIYEIIKFLNFAKIIISENAKDTLKGLYGAYLEIIEKEII